MVGMLSSQPRRRFGDGGEPQEPESSSPAFVLGSDEWPASPERKPKSISSTLDNEFNPPRMESKGSPRFGSQSATATSRTINRASVESQQSQSHINETSTIQKGKLVTLPSTAATRAAQPSSYSASKAAAAPPPRIHPMFQKKVDHAQPRQPSSSIHSSASSYSSVKSSLPQLNTTASRSNPSSDGASSGSSTSLPKKRVNPWENLSPDQTKRSSKTPKTNAGNFGKLSGPGMSRTGSAEGSTRLNLLTSSTLDIKQKVLLSQEQQHVLKSVVEKGESVFFTGSAGK